MRPALLLAFALVTLPLLSLVPATSASQTLVVGPGGFASIQAAVDAASPGDVVFVGEGSYQEAVTIATPGITVKGASRTGVILEGGGLLSDGFLVVADGVRLESMTAQHYTGNGFVFSGVDGFAMHDLHAIDNAVYGLYAIHSQHGDIGYSYAEGHGDGGLYIGETWNCDCDVHHNVAWNNMLGYSGTANSYVRIWANEFHDNRAGILMSVLPNEAGYDTEHEAVYGTQVRSQIFSNYVHHNNNMDVPQHGIWETIHVPAGEGITIAGGWMNEVYDNLLVENHLWGVGIFWLSTPPRGNHVYDNDISGSRYGIWWDEWGEDHCFSSNTILVDEETGQVASDPADLPTCPGLVGPLACPEALYDYAACRGSDVRAPSAIKEAWLAYRAVNDVPPEQDW
jgi:hypothetical protein